MTIDAHRRRDRTRARNVRKVLLYGEDVTKRCIKVDVRRGEVTLYKRIETAGGLISYYIENDSIAREQRRGRVQVIHGRS